MHSKLSFFEMMGDGKEICKRLILPAPYQFKPASNTLTRNVHFTLNNFKLLPSGYLYP